MLDNDYFQYKTNLACVALMRPLLGLTWSFLIYIMLTKEELAWHRPTRWIKAFLEWGIWTPIANLSFSTYLIHLPVMALGDGMINIFKTH